MAGNKGLRKAASDKNDEFYTRFEDINWELQHYTDYFKDKIIYCCCDDGNWSNFWKFFYINFEAFGLKRLIATSYHDGIARDDDETDQAYEYIYEGGYGKSDYVKNNFMEGVTKIKLEEKGDFRSDECKEIFKQCDIVVTNPPFSLFREFIAQLEELEKKYIVWGNGNAITYKEIFPLIKKNKLWFGYMFNKACLFQVPDWYEVYDVKATKKINDGFKYAKVGFITTFTNIENDKHNYITEYYERYDENNYSKYDNYDAIDCEKSNKIPCDYNGIIGVPISWLDKYNPNQFDIIGGFNGYKESDIESGCICGTMTTYIDSKTHKEKRWTGPTINKETKYFRILIRWKPEAMPTIDEDGVILYASEKEN